MECVDEIMGSGNGRFVGGCGRHFNIGGKPGKGVGDAFGAGFVCVDAVAAVVVHSWSEVPPFDAVRCPCCTVVGFLMDQNFCSRGREWGAVEVEGPENKGLGR